MIKLLLQYIGILAMVLGPIQSLCMALTSVNTGGIPLLKPAVLSRFFLATFVIMPALAVVLALSGVAGWPVWTGLLLMSMSPPSGSLVSKSEKLTGTAFGLAWQTISLLLSIVTIPLTLLIVQRIFDLRLNLGIKPVVLKILIFYLVPVAIGKAIRKGRPHAATRLLRPLNKFAQVAMALMVLLILPIAVVAVSKQEIESIALVFLFVACAILIGHAVGGPDPRLRPLLAAGLATRWIALPLILARVNDSTREIAPFLLAYLFSGTLLVAAYGRWLSRHLPPAGRSQPVNRSQTLDLA
jgi:BASS family bile acid:Na+ symporter